jgi:hypothetical protein
MSRSKYFCSKTLAAGTVDDSRYQAYLGEFNEFSNHFQLDEKDGCCGLSAGAVSLVLVITHPDPHAIVEEVFADVDNVKAQCFKKSYKGVRAKMPSFLA